jgi:LmbE family N-acetylglucosaminyl deacetylase
MTCIHKDICEGRRIFVGAHPDDNLIGAFSAIKANPLESLVVTVTDGAPRFPTEYPVPAMLFITTPAEYASVRRREELVVMAALGVPKDNIESFDVSDQEAYMHIDEIIDQLKIFIRSYAPETVFTHEFPQAHPDHEITCFCVHQAVAEISSQVRIAEYPLYFIVPGNEKVVGRLYGTPETHHIRHDFTENDIMQREFLMRQYTSQGNLAAAYSKYHDEFRLLERPRSFDRPLPDVEYIRPWIRTSTPEMIREAIHSVRERRACMIQKQ